MKKSLVYVTLLPIVIGFLYHDKTNDSKQNIVYSVDDYGDVDSILVKVDDKKNKKYSSSYFKKTGVSEIVSVYNDEKENEKLLKLKLSEYGKSNIGQTLRKITKRDDVISI